MIKLILVSHLIVGFLIWIVWYGWDDKKWKLRYLIDNVKKEGLDSFLLLLQLMVFWFFMSLAAVYKIRIKRRKK